MRLENRVAVVTGGSRGMGRACCIALAQEGVSVIVNYNQSKAEADEVVVIIQSTGGKALAVQADVSQDSEARMLIQSAVENFGRLDILVNNAGWTKRTPHKELELLSDEIIEKTLAINTKAPLYCIRAAIPLMQKNGDEGGSIVNITSVAGRMGGGSSIIYGGSKAALTVMTKSLARAFAPNIRINAVAPGMVDTGFGDWPRADVEGAKDRGHINRLVTVEDVAKMVLFLVTDGNALTGEELVVDGGILTLGIRC